MLRRLATDDEASPFSETSEAMRDGLSFKAAVERALPEPADAEAVYGKIFEAFEMLPLAAVALGLMHAHIHSITNRRPFNGRGVTRNQSHTHTIH